MEDTQQICFTPSGRKFQGELGDTLLQVAQDAGIAVRSLCGATIVMFGTVAVAGIKILATVNMNRRNMLILAVSFGMGIGVLLVPQFAGALANNIGGTFGKLIGSIFSSAITTGGLTVLILSAIMGEKVED